MTEAEHAVKWYQDKVRDALLAHKEMEISEGKAVDHSIPKEQGAFDEGDALCRMIGPELEW